MDRSKFYASLRVRGADVFIESPKYRLTFHKECD